MSKDRQEKLTPNSQRELTEPGQNPADLSQIAVELLHEAAFAATLTDPETARRECVVESDVQLSLDDEKAGETMFINAAVQGITAKDSLVAPIVKMLARRRSKRVRSNHWRRSKVASRKRLQYISSLQGSDQVFLSWRSKQRTFPMMPVIDMHYAPGPRTVSLNPYQIQACGVIELVRASGRVLGACDGDWLADQFMRMILDLSGKGDWKDGAENIAGRFALTAERGEGYDENWSRLEGRDEMLAVTVLAGWLRMSRLGVLLASRDRMLMWEQFYDDTIYGADDDLLGEVWNVKARTRTEYELASPWIAAPELPWVAKSDGSPVPVVGVAGEVFRRAIIAVQSLSLVPDDFELEAETKQEPCYEKSNRIVTQLKKTYREIAGSPIGSVVRVVAPDEWN